MSTFPIIVTHSAPVFAGYIIMTMFTPRTALRLSIAALVGIISLAVLGFPSIAIAGDGLFGAHPGAMVYLVIGAFCALVSTVACTFALYLLAIYGPPHLTSHLWLKTALLFLTTFVIAAAVMTDAVHDSVACVERGGDLWLCLPGYLQ